MFVLRTHCNHTSSRCFVLVHVYNWMCVSLYLTELYMNIDTTVPRLLLLFYHFFCISYVFFFDNNLLFELFSYYIFRQTLISCLQNIIGYFFVLLAKFDLDKPLSSSFFKIFGGMRKANPAAPHMVISRITLSHF